MLSVLASKAQFTITGQFRPRTEFRNGYKTQRDSTTKPAIVTSQRSRIIFNYKNEKLITNFSLQDVRMWGETKNKSDIPSIGIHEAWAKLLFSDNYSLKLGRQELKYDDKRILSWNNWNNIGSSHDIALFQYEKSELNVHLGLAYNNDVNKNFESNYPENFYKTMQFLLLSKKYNNGFNFSLIGLADGYQKYSSDKTIYTRGTCGGNIGFNKDSSKVELYGTFYRQLGKDKYGKDISAYFFHAKASYKLCKKLKITTAIDYFSGNDALDTNNMVNNAFNNLYGTGHGFYGSMDYFTVIDNHTKGSGLTDIYSRINYNITNKIYAEATYHIFFLSNNAIDINYIGVGLKEIDKNLGSEVDILFNYKFNKEVNIKFGYSLMFATESMNIIKEGDNSKYANWVFVVVAIRPTFLKS